MSVPGEQSQVRARGGHTKPNGEEGSAPSDLNVAPSHENLHLVKGISIQMGQGHGVYITELDKSGNVTQRWLHTPDNQVIQVRRLPYAEFGDLLRSSSGRSQGQV